MNAFQDLFDRQKRYFATGVTRSYAWRTEQLDRMGRLVKGNEAFGPILPVLTYRTLDEAFSSIAAAPRPLAAFIFSRNQARSIASSANSLSAAAQSIK